jgi:hypothetical protein
MLPSSYAPLKQPALHVFARPRRHRPPPGRVSRRLNGNGKAPTAPVPSNDEMTRAPSLPILHDEVRRSLDDLRQLRRGQAMPAKLRLILIVKHEVRDVWCHTPYASNCCCTTTRLGAHRRTSRQRQQLAYAMSSRCEVRRGIEPMGKARPLRLLLHRPRRRDLAPPRPFPRRPRRRGPRLPPHALRLVSGGKAKQTLQSRCLLLKR